MNKDQWRKYNREKQWEYRCKKRGGLPRSYINEKRAEEIFKSVGHCAHCGMKLESEYHQKHPLVGCLISAERGLNY